MLQVHPDSALVPLLQRIVDADDIHVHLYVNDLTPDRDTVLGDLTEMPNGGGYIAGGIDVPGDEWGLSDVVDHKGLLMRLPVEWTATSTEAQTVYGYYLTNAANDTLLAVGRFDAPIDWDNEQVFAVWPVLGDQSVYGA